MSPYQSQSIQAQWRSHRRSWRNSKVVDGQDQSRSGSETESNRLGNAQRNERCTLWFLMDLWFVEFLNDPSVQSNCHGFLGWEGFSVAASHLLGCVPIYYRVLIIIVWTLYTDPVIKFWFTQPVILILGQKRNDNYTLIFFTFIEIFVEKYILCNSAAWPTYK